VFANTKVGDRGLRHLKGLTKLQILLLYNTTVGDAGLVHLKGLKQLKRVWLFGTRVTDEGVSDLQQAVPKAEIRSEGF